jgi:hypothetical protein
MGLAETVYYPFGSGDTKTLGMSVSSGERKSFDRFVEAPQTWFWCVSSNVTAMWGGFAVISNRRPQCDVKTLCVCVAVGMEETDTREHIPILGWRSSSRISPVGHHKQSPMDQSILGCVCEAVRVSLQSGNGFYFRDRFNGRVIASWSSSGVLCSHSNNAPEDPGSQRVVERSQGGNGLGMPFSLSSSASAHDQVRREFIFGRGGYRNQAINSSESSGAIGSKEKEFCKVTRQTRDTSIVIIYSNKQGRNSMKQ